MFRLTRIRAKPFPIQAASRPRVPSSRPLGLSYARQFGGHDPGVARFQRVRVQSPPVFSLRHNIRRVASVGIVVGTFLIFFEAVGRYLDSADLDDLEDEDGEEDEDEESWYIPLGWSKPKPRTYYKASDPEWQGFLKIAKDPKEREHIQMSLLAVVRSDVARSAVAARELGRIDVRKGRWWLDLFFPDGPPPEYERLAIEIAPDYVALSRQTVDQRSYQRLLQTLQPTAIVASLYATSRYLFGNYIGQVQTLLGLPTAEERHKRKISEVRSREDEIAQKHQQSPMNKASEVLAKNFRDQNPTRPSEQQQSDSNQPPPPNSPAFQMPRPHRPAGASENAQSDTEKDFKKLEQQKRLPSQNDGQALAVFQNTLRRNWRGLKLTVPRGCVFVAGRVEVLGDKGRAIVDVGGAWDPELRQYVAISGHVRALQPHSQSPKGGR